MCRQNVVQEHQLYYKLASVTCRFVFQISGPTIRLRLSSMEYNQLALTMVGQSASQETSHWVKTYNVIPVPTGRVSFMSSSPAKGKKRVLLPGGRLLVKRRKEDVERG